MTKAMKWEQKMKEARALRKQGSELLYDRVSLLVACYEDEEFRSWCAASEINDMTYLDDELSDVAATFLTLRAVLEAYPDRESWTKHNIRDLIDEAIDATKPEKLAHSRKSWKAIAAELQAECERLRAEVASLKETLGIVAGAKCA